MFVMGMYNITWWEGLSVFNEGELRTGRVVCDVGLGC